VRQKWDDHETRPLAHATFILTLPHSHIDVGPREQAKLLFLVKHRTTMSLVHHTVACAQFHTEQTDEYEATALHMCMVLSLLMLSTEGS